MIKLGVNSVLFKTVSFREAAEAIKKCGYDGVEISAIAGMCEHLDLANWKTQKAELIAIREELDLPFISTEVASQDRERLLTAFEACAEIGIPIVNIGPGGKMDDEETLKQSCEIIQSRAEDAEKFGVADKEIVSVKVSGTGREAILGDVVVRVSPKFATAMHIDTDESNAICASGNCYGEIVK